MTAPSPFPAALSLVAVVDVAAANDAARVDALLENGVTCVWLRDPQAHGRALYDAAGGLLLRCRRLGGALLVGDRADVAAAVGADGVQIGYRAPPPRAVRASYRGWLGVSCHDGGEVAIAEEAGADHVVLSPVFGVPKRGVPLGVSGLTALLRVTSRPAVALGGIGPQNVAEVRKTGVAGVAAIRALRDAADPAGAARALSATVTPR